MQGEGAPTWALSCLLSLTLAQEPRNAESLYCDLPRGPPAPEDPPGTSAPSLQSVADQGLRPEPER